MGNIKRRLIGSVFLLPFLSLACIMLNSSSALAQGIKIPVYLQGKDQHVGTHADLAFFAADTAVQATGTAVIMFIDKSGSTATVQNGKGYAIFDTLKTSLQKKGVAVFMLHEPITEKYTDESFATDGLDAVAFIRSHAGEYKVLSDHIGIVGYAGGATAALRAARSYTMQNRPDFVGLLNIENSDNKPIKGEGDRKTKGPIKRSTAGNVPPIFLASNSSFARKNEFHADFLKADTNNQPDLHLYSGGAAMLLDLLDHWMDRTGLLKPISNEKTYSQKMSEGFANLQKYYDHLTFTDWSWLFRYEGANRDLKPPLPGKKRVVFMGNSITEYWYDKDAAFFNDNDYVNRGIGGQVSAQMLVRFREDVIALKPDAVVIEAGTNDIAENRGPISLENILGNIVSMAELARTNGIIPIIGSVLPSTQFTWAPKIKPADKIIKLNDMLKAYALKNNFVYVDYWSVLVNDQKGLKVDLAQDGFSHPNIAGYKVMEPIVKAGIEKALGKHIDK